MSNIEPTPPTPATRGLIEGWIGSWVDFVRGPPGIMAGIMALLALVGTGIAVDVIAERYRAGESIAELADDYGREETEIEEAIRARVQAA